MFCHKCGAQINDDSIFCNKCGASVGGMGTGMGTYGAPVKRMSKKEYFASGYCTDKAKGLIKYNWILYGVLCAALIFTLVTSASAILKVSDAIDADMDFAEFIDCLEDVSGESLGLTAEDYEAFEQMGAQLDMPIESMFQWVLDVVVGTIVFFNILFLVFQTVAVWRKSTGFAITALVIAAMYSGKLIVIGLSIAILVLTVKLNREYKEYCNHYTVFPNGGMNNEPDFT